MESVGQLLKDAREQKHMTVSDICSATKAKKLIVEGIEHDDFSLMPAPIYAKGFIKLYAECVNIDPVPLIKTYTIYYMPGAMSSKISPPLQKYVRKNYWGPEKTRQIKAKIQLVAEKISFALMLESFRTGKVKHWIYLHKSRLSRLSPRIFGVMFERCILKIKDKMFFIIQWFRLRIQNMSLPHIRLHVETWKTIVSITGVGLLVAAAITGIILYSGGSETPISKFLWVKEPPPPYLDTQGLLSSHTQSP